MKSYVYPSLPWKYAHFGIFRFSGAGLGNLLFPWARAMVDSYKYGLIPIWPTWPQLYLSRTFHKNIEYLKRNYFFLFKPTQNYIRGPRKYLILLSKKKVNEEEIQTAKYIDQQVIYVYKGMDKLFQPLIGFHGFLRHQLISITKKSHKKLLFPIPFRSISVHVRLGDLDYATSISDLIEKPGHFRLPMDWYIKQIKDIRSIVGDNLPIYIFSDGSVKEIQPLLKLGNANLINSGSAIADLLTMATSSLLICGFSTFAMWASYLGQCTTLYFTGHMRQQLIYSHSSMQAETNFDGEMPDEFRIFLRKKLK